jgi:hypothetical protein
MTTTQEAIKPTARNAFLTWLIPALCFAAAPPLGGLLGTTAFRFAPNAAILVGIGIFAFSVKTMVAELTAVTGGAVVWWHLLIPIYGIYLAVTAIPSEMAKAKQKMGKQPPRSVIVYLFFFLYAFAADINDLAR